MPKNQKPIDVAEVHSIACMLMASRLDESNCASFDVANRRLHNLGRRLMDALGEDEDDVQARQKDPAHAP